MTMHPLHLKVMTWSSALFGAVTYVLCVLYGLIAPKGLHATQLLESLLPGFKCPACVRTVEEAIRGVPGVESASVNLATARAFVTYDSSRTSLAAIHDAIKKAGYRVGLGRARFHIKGMTCASCVTRIERALEGTPGVVRATVSLGAE